MYMSDNAILANSIWPNGIKVDADGHAVFYPLGTNKIEVPSEDEWPKGDTLVSPFVYEDGLLVGFVDTKAMIVSGNTSITLPYEHIDADFSSIVQGDLMVNAPNAEYKNFIWAVVAGEGGEGGGVEINFKYKGCTTVSEVKTVEPQYYNVDIIDGAWTESLADLENGYQMFRGYYVGRNLKSFHSDLSSLTNSAYMFQEQSSLETFEADMPNLTNSGSMFMYCHSLKSFKGDLSSLANGHGMFADCTNLEIFESDLSSLTNGVNMFKYWGSNSCKLNTASVQNIADTINDVNNLTNCSYSSAEIYKTIDIGIGNKTPNDEEKIAFNTIVSKGWTVRVNGSQYTPTSPAAITTLDENGEEITTPIPFYAKPVPSNEKDARYVDAEGNFYNIVGGQFIYGDDLSTYGMFTCEEDAAANMRLTKIGQEEIETA